MKRIAALILPLLATLYLVAVAGPARAATTATDDSSASAAMTTLRSSDVAAAGPFHLLFYHSRKCADLPRYSPVNGVQLDQWTCVPQTNEQWYLDYVGTAGGVDWFRIRNRASGKCMNISNYSPNNGGRVIQWTCGSYANEYFTFFRDPARMPSGYWLAKNYYSGKCINVAGARRDNGAPLIQWTCGYYSNEYIHLSLG